MKKGWRLVYAAMKLHFIWAALLAFVLGVLLAALLGESFSAPAAFWPRLLVGIGTAAALITLAALVANRPVFLLPLFLLLGIAWSGLAQARLLSFAVPPGEAVFFRGRVVEVSAMEINLRNQNSSYRFIIEGEEQNGWRGRLLILASPLQPRVGDDLAVCALVIAPNDSYNFVIGGSRYYAANALAAAAEAVPQGISFRRLASPYAPQSMGLAMREKLFRAMEILPPRQQALLKGIGFGDTSLLTNGESGVLAQTGIMHIFAVSGLHIGYVVLLGCWLGRALKMPGWLRFACTAAMVMFFALVAGLTASVVRAAVMTLVGGLGVLLADFFIEEEGVPSERQVLPRSLRSLILAAFLLLLWRPGWALQPGFLLSFLATAGIVCTADCWRALLPSRLLSLSMAAQFAIMPVAAYFFNTVSLVGLLLSPFLACLAGGVVILLLLAMPLTLLGLAGIPLAAAGLLADLMYQAAELLARLPLAFAYTLRPSLLALLLYYLLLAAALYFMSKAKTNPLR